MLEQTRKVRTQQCVSREPNRNERQGPTHGPARSLQQSDEQNAAHHDVCGTRVANTECEIGKNVRYIKHTHRARSGQKPINQRDTTGAK